MSFQTLTDTLLNSKVQQFCLLAIYNKTCESNNIQAAC